MIQISNQTQKHTNNFVAMEAETINKNAVIPKNHKSRRNFFKKSNFALLVASIILIGCHNKVDTQTINEHDGIKPYVNFLENNKFLSAKEYILSKFKTYDIVILSERHHYDATQYEVILDVIKDERFKGNIYTEVGVANMHKKINNFLLNSTFTEEEKERELLKIYRDIDYSVLWEPYSYYHLLSEVYDINKNKENEEKILIFPTDVVFSWAEYKTNGGYEAFDKLVGNSMQGIDRNLVMGMNFVDFYEMAKKENPKKQKALVIMNTYHGYTRIPTYLPLPTQPYIYSTGEYIYKTYPDKTFNIYINYLKSGSVNLSNDGIIDAAFEYTKKDNIGFDMKGTPIGNTKFDLYNFGDGYDTVNFDYIFDGMIFYKPLIEMVIKSGIPNIYPKEHEKQFFSRVAIVNNQTLEEAMNDKENIEWLKSINNTFERSLGKEELEWITKQIKKWIE